MPAMIVDKALRLMLGAAHKLLKVGWFYGARRVSARMLSHCLPKARSSS
jgi:hypothetical protein